MPDRRFVVHGRVQGVGFRWWTRLQADRLGVSGTVCNRSDGTVEVRARGTPEQLDALRELLGRGPAGARVQRVEEEPRPRRPRRRLRRLPLTFTRT